jgi:GT2 family glycosyltransferase
MQWLPGCVESVRSQELADLELLVLDNSSTDGSVEWLREVASQEPRMSLTASPENLGFATAHNRHIGQARGEYVLLLNQDVELDPAFLREGVAAFRGRPRVAAVQGRLHRLGPDGNRTETLDSTGLVMQRDRRVASRRQGQRPNAGDDVAGPVWGADGPAPVYRRAALVDAREPRTGGGWEVLDEDFFMYKEDVDLAWRLRLLGWTAWYQPSSVAWHSRTARGPGALSLYAIARQNLSLPSWITALSWRNQRLMQLKNERVTDFIRDLPWIARREILSLGFIVLADPGRLRSLPELVWLIPAARRKRRYLHARLARAR